jgi:hypothetical protein
MNKKLLAYLLVVLLFECSSPKDRETITTLQIENDSLKNLLTKYQEHDLQNKQKNKDAFDKEKKNSLGLVLNDQIKVVKMDSGFDPYNDDHLWLPEVTIMFKNITDKNIKALVEVKAIFINNTSGEQLGEAMDYLCSDSRPFIKGTQKQISLKSSVGWTAGVSHNVSVIIYVGDDEFKTVKIKNKEFSGRI